MMAVLRAFISHFRGLRERKLWKKMDKTTCTGLHDLFSSTNITRMSTSKEIRWVDFEACKEMKGDTYRLFVAKHEGKRPFGIQGVPGGI